MGDVFSFWFDIEDKNELQISQKLLSILQMRVNAVDADSCRQVKRIYFPHRHLLKAAVQPHYIDPFHRHTIPEEKLPLNI